MTDDEWSSLSGEERIAVLALAYAHVRLARKCSIWDESFRTPGESGVLSAADAATVLAAVSKPTMLRLDLTEDVILVTLQPVADAAARSFLSKRGESTYRAVSDAAGNVSDVRV
jgi:hypothetical protein